MLVMRKERWNLIEIHEETRSLRHDMIFPFIPSSFMFIL